VGVELPAVDGAAVLDELVKELGDAVPPHPLRREMRIEIDANNTMLAMALRASCMEPSENFSESTQTYSTRVLSGAPTSI
jgi:hypothetical protein